ncbi:hypothetical protein CRUP_004629 [Coryphaenoides rupestris]|nr:hypothetical protein CRUP_004629 [Coryphaenoides rupestris]
MLVKEQMFESSLTFHLPSLLLDNLIQEERARIQELNDLCDLSPDWDLLRHDVIGHCSQLIGWYEETLSEVNRLKGISTFKSSQRKADRHVQFVPTNLHLQRMEVKPHPDHTGVCYDVITASRARALLASVAQLQPLIFGLSEEMLSSSLVLSPRRLQHAMDTLAYQTGQFVHALKDELVRSTLLALHTLSPAPSTGHAPLPADRPGRCFRFGRWRLQSSGPPADGARGPGDLCPVFNCNALFKDGHVILESPGLPVTEGHHVTLSCRTTPPPFRSAEADFYKDGVLLGRAAGARLTLRRVSMSSHQGLYRCSVDGLPPSPESWLAIAAAPPPSTCHFLPTTRLLWSHAVLAVPFLLSTIFMILIYRDRAAAPAPRTCTPVRDDVVTEEVT